MKSAPMPENPAPAVVPPASSVDGFSPDELRDLYRRILFPRLIEEKMLVLLRQGRLSKWFSGIGQEAISVGVVSALRGDDWILPTHRNLGVFTGRGLDLVRLLRQLMGKDGGFSKGRERSFHFGYLPARIVGMISHLGSMLPVADGLALAARLKGTDTVAAAFCGDGATSEGDFHEALNLAAVWKLPVLFVCENNEWQAFVHRKETMLVDDVSSRAAGYGIEGRTVDGNDVEAVFAAASEAVAKVRETRMPFLLETRTYRLRGHFEPDDQSYVDAGELASWKRRDPIPALTGKLLAAGALTPADVAAMERRVSERLEAAFAFAAESPWPSPDQLTTHVYA